MSTGIDYGNLMHEALRTLIKSVLTQVGENGLPGDHHFYITFDTQHPDVEMADWLSDRYPGEMTIVVQHWFDNLNVDDEGFGITLNFGDSPEPLYIPFAALTTFADPSVEFGLKFEAHQSEDEAEAEPEPHPEPEEAPKGEAEVVSLDQFRRDQ